MRLISFVLFVAMGLTASAQDQGYVVDGYIGDDAGLILQEYGIGNEYVDEYVPAPPDYRKKKYPKPKTYPEYTDLQWEETYQPPQPETVDEVYERAYAETNGACDTKKNPHSYACTDWNFKGNGVFPLFKMRWWDVMQGPWFSVTYVRPGSGPIKCANGIRIKGGENKDCEFSMKKNPQRPTQPLGIINTQSGDLMGQMWIDGATVSWENWLGQTVWTDPNSFMEVDDYTVQFTMYEGQYSHLFICRDFNRNSNHHLLCKWLMQFPGQNNWVEKGYMGFLTMDVWNGFIGGNR